MSKTIFLDVSHPQLEPGRIEGFRFLWAYYVNGYRADRHCQSCFKGRLAREFSSHTACSGRVIAFDRMARYPYLYICGVAAGPRGERRLRNLHVPLQFSEGHLTEVRTYNGYVFRARNAVSVVIPPLPAGWNGIDDTEHTGCKNFQFAVAAFGDPAIPSAPRNRNRRVQ
jgi:hypothetical protein